MPVGGPGAPAGRGAEAGGDEERLHELVDVPSGAGLYRRTTVQARERAAPAVRAGKRKARGDEKLPGGGGRQIAWYSCFARLLSCQHAGSPSCANALADHVRRRAETRSKAIRAIGLVRE